MSCRYMTPYPLQEMELSHLCAFLLQPRMLLWAWILPSYLPLSLGVFQIATSSEGQVAAEWTNLKGWAFQNDSMQHQNHVRFHSMFYGRKVAWGSCWHLSWLSENPGGKKSLKRSAGCGWNLNVHFPTQVDFPFQKVQQWDAQAVGAYPVISS